MKNELINNILGIYEAKFFKIHGYAVQTHHG